MVNTQRTYGGKIYYADLFGHPFWTKTMAEDRSKKLREMGLLVRITKSPVRTMGKYMVWVHKSGRS